MTAMRSGDLPSYLTITQLAGILGLTRKSVAYRVSRGIIPSEKLGTAPNAQRVVFLSAVKRHFPELWEAIVLKTDVLTFDLDEDEDEDER